MALTGRMLQTELALLTLHGIGFLTLRTATLRLHLPLTPLVYRVVQRFPDFLERADLDTPDCIGLSDACFGISDRRAYVSKLHASSSPDSELSMDGVLLVETHSPEEEGESCMELLFA